MTLDCDLPYKSHELVHNIPDISGETGISYCTVCHTAYFEKTWESFHPSVAPDGVTATRTETREINFDKGVASEACSVGWCTATGPHWACACGATLTSKTQSHTRKVYRGPENSWVITELRSGISGYSTGIVDGERRWTYTVTLPAGTYGKIKSDIALKQSAYDLYLNDSLVYSFDGYGPSSHQTGRKDYDFYVSAETSLRITGTGYNASNVDVCTFTPTDADGTKWYVPIVKSYYSHASSMPLSYCMYSIDTTYNDGIKTVLIANVHGNEHPTTMSLHLNKGQMVTMTVGSTTWSAGIYLLNKSGTVVASDKETYATPKAFLRFIVPEDGDYNVQVQGDEWSYDSENGTTYHSDLGVPGTIYIEDAVHLA